MSTNRRTGNGFEKDLCQKLSKHGFWAHNLAQNSQGQPFDVIAARNGVSYPIDCKDCSKDIFKLDRIEENQFSSMLLWKETGNGNGWFALRLIDGTIYMISVMDMAASMCTKTVLGSHEIKKMGWTLSEWVSICK